MSRLIGDFKREKETAELKQTTDIVKKEEEAKERQVMHEAAMVQLKDRLTDAKISVDRQLEDLQKRYDTETSQLKTRVQDLEQTCYTQNDLIKSQQAEKEKIQDDLESASSKVKQD